MVLVPGSAQMSFSHLERNHPLPVLNVGKYYLVSPEILPVRNFIGIVNQHPLEKKKKKDL